MSNKQLNETNIVNELKGSSLFFEQKDVRGTPSSEKNHGSETVVRLPHPEDHDLPLSPAASVSSVQAPSQPPPSPLPKTPKETSLSPLLPTRSLQASSGQEVGEGPPRDSESKNNPIPSENIESILSATDASAPDSADASTLAQYQDRVVDEIRKTIKSYGKEISYVRLTPEEKDLLAEITYTYKRQGIKTSENEINRIAVNFLLTDFKENGEASILNRVIQALLA